MRHGSPRALALVSLVLALVFVVSTGLGILHAGVEWKFWLARRAVAAGWS